MGQQQLTRIGWPGVLPSWPQEQQDKTGRWPRVPWMPCARFFKDDAASGASSFPTKSLDTTATQTLGAGITACIKVSRSQLAHSLESQGWPPCQSQSSRRSLCAASTLPILQTAHVRAVRNTVLHREACPALSPCSAAVHVQGPRGSSHPRPPPGSANDCKWQGSSNLIAKANDALSLRLDSPQKAISSDNKTTKLGGWV